ncbi:MAG: M2 family metallopeptidase [Planctomycetes bacterium]|nr:M2 family metallopeptidase [Planctomycetota bacterium]
MNSRTTTAACAAALLACGACFMSQDPAEVALRSEVQRYVDRYGPEFQERHRLAAEARWAARTRARQGDVAAIERVRAAEEALAEFTGSTENIELSRAYLRRKRELFPRQIRELETILRRAGGSSQTARTLVAQRIGAEAEQAAALLGFRHELDGRPVTAAALDALLRSESDAELRLRAWESAMAPGPRLCEGLVALRSLRNEAVRALGHGDYYAYAAGAYGLSPGRLSQQMFEIQRELRPLLQELHTWARHELATRRGEPVPDLIPAHWLPSPWDADWSALVPVAGFDLDGALGDVTPLGLVELGERSWTSLGFEPLPVTFWERSSLLPAPVDAGWTKGGAPSAWHIDLARDVRLLLDVVPSAASYLDVHRELGRVQHFLQYATPDVPIVLRAGASRAWSDSLGSVLGLAAMQPRFVAAAGLQGALDAPDRGELLLQEALRHVVPLFWAGGVVFEWERELYTQNLPVVRWNARWWELMAQALGVAPPPGRGARACDPAAVPAISLDPAAAHDRVLAAVLSFQLHDHIARNILREDPHDTLYFGRRDVGDFLRSVMRPGATVDWIQLLRDRTGQSLSARPMVDYFEPLRRRLAEVNRGRTSTLPPL